MSGIKENWNNLPTSVRMGAKCILAIAVVSAVGYAAGEINKMYYRKTNEVPTESGVVLEDVAVVVEDEAEVVVVKE
jgi:hypothetical protein